MRKTQKPLLKYLARQVPFNLFGAAISSFVITWLFHMSDGWRLVELVCILVMLTILDALAWYANS